MPSLQALSWPKRARLERARLEWVSLEKRARLGHDKGQSALAAGISRQLQSSLDELSAYVCPTTGRSDRKPSICPSIF
ncbi:MAG: hypothetical protein QGH53_02090 [Prochlorococcaceae cyanobacterium ETNP18_MAG_1]|nr:hypothetical protein [Prochlorococcaceae cyanobacterium ETNP18_MAG_1]